MKGVAILWCIVLALFFGNTCTQSKESNQDTMISTDIIDEASAQWLSIQGVEGVAEGEKDGKPCILVMTSAEPSELSSKIPDTFKGYVVVLEKTGEIKAY